MSIIIERAITAAHEGGWTVQLLLTGGHTIEGTIDIDRNDFGAVQLLANNHAVHIDPAAVVGLVVIKPTA